MQELDTALGRRSWELGEFSAKTRQSSPSSHAPEPDPKIPSVAAASDHKYPRRDQIRVVRLTSESCRGGRRLARPLRAKKTRALHKMSRGRCGSSVIDHWV
jgi:hypothetical protein